jgi:hypothetical protein
MASNICLQIENAQSSWLTLRIGVITSLCPLGVVNLTGMIPSANLTGEHKQLTYRVLILDVNGYGILMRRNRAN